jgi:DNA-binding transcriptional ArsR family regulator
MSTMDTGMAEVFRALAHEDRLAILEHLRSAPRGQAGVLELADASGISRFAASHHLGVLRCAGLIVMSKQSHRHLHRVDATSLHAIEDWAYRFDTQEDTAHTA